MIYQSIMDKVGRKSQLLGIAGELDALKTDLSSLMVANKAIVTAAVGPPAGSAVATKQETLDKLKRYERPDNQGISAILAGLTVGELVKLTQESIKFKKKFDPPPPTDLAPAPFLQVPAIPQEPPMPPAPPMPAIPMPDNTMPTTPILPLEPQGPPMPHAPLPLEQPSLLPPV